MSLLTDKTKVGLVIPKAQAPKEASVVIIYPSGPDLGKRYPIDRDEVTLGREPSNTVVLDNENVSRAHARLLNDGSSVALEDLGSTNGTQVNDKDVKRCDLRNGDIIKIGSVVLKYITGGNTEALYHEEIYRMTIQDGLTAVPNRRYFEDFLEREFARAKRYERPLSLAMFDIDKFKSINDRFGHLAGDYVLRRMAATLKTTIRREELLARYGGEEFAVIMPETPLDKAKAFADKLRALVEATTFEFDGVVIPVTISVGLAKVDPALADPPSLVRAADGALYRAKNDGRNCVRVAAGN